MIVFKYTESDHRVLDSEDMFIAIYGDDISIFNKHNCQLKKLQKKLEIRF